MTDIKYFISFCFLFFYSFVYDQSNDPIATDSLKGKTYEYILNKLDNDDLSDDSYKIYNDAYLSKAKSEKNWEQLVNAYKNQLHLAEKKDRVFYADSMIDASKHSQNLDLIGSSYLTKGILYYDLMNYNNALDNYLIANDYIVKTQDKYLQHKVKYNIAQIKYYLGFYHDAIILFNDNLDYFRNHDDIPYLTSLHSIALCYNRLEKYDLCTKTNDFGIKEAERLEYFEAIPRFVNSEAINQYFKKTTLFQLANSTKHYPAL